MIRKNDGFTAFELALTLAIMSIMAGLLMPSYLNWLRTSRLRWAANNLISDMEMAKIRAIRENSFVAVQFQPTGYTIFVDDGEGGATAGDWVRSGSERLLRNRDLPAGVVIDLGTMTLTDNRVRFNGRGLPPEVVSNEDISIKNERGAKTVTLNRLGLLELSAV